MRSSVRSSGSPFVLVGLFLFGSGFAALSYQVVWLRLLRLVFGASTSASAAVLAIFMGGLGAGGLLLGPRADRSDRPLAFYAKLELGVALAAALTPLLAAGAAAAYVAVGGTFGIGAFRGTAVRLVLSWAVLGVPTFLMGGTLPAAVRAVTGPVDVARRAAGRLYGLNTLGAVAGAIVTTFWLVERFGMRGALWFAAALNLVIALGAWLVARRTASMETESLAAGRGRGVGRPVLVASLVVGFVFLLMELVWYRLLAPILGGSTYTFGIILAVALAGIGIGGFLYSIGETGRRPRPIEFAFTAAAEAVLIGWPLLLGDRLPLLAHVLRGLGAAGFATLAAGWVVVVSLVVLPAAVVAGYQFPLLIAIAGAGREGVGREVGRVYAWNTAGAILGALAGGFGAMSLLSAPGLWRLAGLVLVVLALGSALFCERSGLDLGALSLLVIAALACLLRPEPSDFWRHSGIGAGRLERAVATPNELEGAVRASSRAIEWAADGRESSIALSRENGFAFVVNGKVDGNARADAPTQVMGGLVGSFLHPEPRTSLVIGLGTGSSAGWLAAVPTMERVDVVELEPLLVRVAEACTPVNRSVLANPRVQLLFGDGREFLWTTRSSYDVIFSEPSNPYRAGVVSLFTRELYEAAEQRLRPGGIFLQWLQAYEVDAEVVATAYATLRSVFPVVETWQLHRGDMLLVAAREPIPHDTERARRRATEEPYASALSRVWGVQGAEGFYAGYLGGPDLAATIERTVTELNTDDRSVMEFGFIRNLGRPWGLDLLALARWSVRLGTARAPLDLDWELVDELRAARMTMLDRPPDRQKSRSHDRVIRDEARAAFLRGDTAGAVALWNEQGDPPRSPIDLLLVGEGLAESGDDRAEAVATDLRRYSAVEADAVLARLAARRGELEVAVRHLESALVGYRVDPWPFVPFMARVLVLGRELGRAEPSLAPRVVLAAGERFTVSLLDQQRQTLLVDLGVGNPALDCVPAFQLLEPEFPWLESLLAARLDCYESRGRGDAIRAAAELRRYREQAPVDLGRLMERAGMTDSEPRIE